MRILLIEDEENLRKIVRYDMKRSGYDMDEASDGDEGLALALEHPYDVILIDWMLPKRSGVDIVKKLRSENIQSIIFMLTAKSDESDILYAFEQGVDDYLTKPFSNLELIARIKSHMKRVVGNDEVNTKLGSLQIHPKKRSATIDEHKLDLTQKEFELLAYLVAKSDTVVSRDEILNEVWGFDYDGDTRIVDVHIFKLRHKLKEYEIEIESIRGVGYMVKSDA